MYLYVFEDGTIRQSQDAPSEEDLASIGNGDLQVLTLVGAKFVHYSAEFAINGHVQFLDVPQIGLSPQGFHYPAV